MERSTTNLIDATITNYRDFSNKLIDLESFIRVNFPQIWEEYKPDSLSPEENFKTLLNAFYLHTPTGLLISEDDMGVTYLALADDFAVIKIDSEHLIGEVIEATIGSDDYLCFYAEDGVTYTICEDLTELQWEVCKKLKSNLGHDVPSARAFFGDDVLFAWALGLPATKGGIWATSFEEWIEDVVNYDLESVIEGEIKTGAIIKSEASELDEFLPFITIVE